MSLQWTVLIPGCKKINVLRSSQILQEMLVLMQSVLVGHVIWTFWDEVSYSTTTKGQRGPQPKKMQRKQNTPPSEVA